MREGGEGEREKKKLQLGKRKTAVRKTACVFSWEQNERW